MLSFFQMPQLYLVRGQGNPARLFSVNQDFKKRRTEFFCSNYVLSCFFHSNFRFIYHIAGIEGESLIHIIAECNLFRQRSEHSPAARHLNTEASQQIIPFHIGISGIGNLQKKFGSSHRDMRQSHLADTFIHKITGILRRISLACGARL